MDADATRGRARKEAPAGPIRPPLGAWRGPPRAGWAELGIHSICLPRAPFGQPRCRILAQLFRIPPPARLDGKFQPLRTRSTRLARPPPPSKLTIARRSSTETLELARALPAARPRPQAVSRALSGPTRLPSSLRNNGAGRLRSGDNLNWSPCPVSKFALLLVPVRDLNLATGCLKANASRRARSSALRRPPVRPSGRLLGRPVLPVSS